MAEPWSVRIVGASHWASVLGALLRAAGIASVYDDGPARFHGRLVGRAQLVRWALGNQYPGTRAIHHVWVSRSLLMLPLLRVRGRPQILHWIGSDVLAVRALSGPLRRLWAATARRIAPLQMADSPELAEEVHALGLPRPRVVRLLPLTLRAQPLPLPATPAALSYWSDGTIDKYRGRWVLQLAREFPDVPFHVVGRCTPVPGAPANVNFVGWVDDMTPWYERATVLLRLPEHDSISVMVLEMLARARHAIYSRPLPHCAHATTCEEARAALARLLADPGPNTDGPALVAREFNPDDAVAALRQAYAELGQGDGSAQQ